MWVTLCDVTRVCVRGSVCTYMCVHMCVRTGRRDQGFHRGVNAHGSLPRSGSLELRLSTF